MVDDDQLGGRNRRSQVFGHLEGNDHVLSTVDHQGGLLDPAQSRADVDVSPDPRERHRIFGGDPVEDLVAPRDQVIDVGFGEAALDEVSDESLVGIQQRHLEFTWAGVGFRVGFGVVETVDDDEVRYPLGSGQRCAECRESARGLGCDRGSFDAIRVHHGEEILDQVVQCDAACGTDRCPGPSMVVRDG